ncbi:MAG: MATE family efflux transporter [Oscillospiraceae bacterium]|jgi:putative MATE family efflux protein
MRFGIQTGRFMVRKSLINDMSEGPLFKQLVFFSLPIILGNILQSFYNIADMFIVGNFVGAAGLSAVGIGGMLQGLLLMAGMGMGFGGQILLSQQVGAGDIDGINESVGTFFSASAIFAVILGVLGAALYKPLLSALNTPAEVYGQALSYYLICCCGLLFIYGYNAVCAVLRGMGESKLPTIIIAIASVINILLDLLFIAVMKMDSGGAALATVIAQGAAFLMAAAYLYRHRNSFKFDFKLKSFKINYIKFRAIMKLSMPLIIYGFLISLSFMFINSNVNIFGVAASAVDGVGSKLGMIANAVTMAIYSGGATIVGQCFGAGNFERIRKLYYLTLSLSLAFWAFTSALMLVFPVQIFRIFTADEAVLEMAPRYLRISVLMFFGMAFSTGTFAIIEGVGNTMLEMWVGIVENLAVKIGLAMLFSSMMGLFGYWLGNALASFTTPIVGNIYFFSGRWKKRKPVLKS